MRIRVFSDISGTYSTLNHATYPNGESRLSSLDESRNHPEVPEAATYIYMNQSEDLTPLTKRKHVISERVFQEDRHKLPPVEWIDAMGLVKIALG